MEIKSGQQSTTGQTALVKTCQMCGEEKSITKFNKNKTKDDGVQTYCRECDNALNRLRRSGQFALTKRCRCCQRILDHTRFCKHPHMKDGLQSWCKQCNNEAKYHARNTNTWDYTIAKLAKSWGVPEGWNEYVRCARSAKG